MKRIILFLTALIIFSQTYCQSIKISSGYAEGNVAKGQKIYILANRCPTGTVFDHWTSTNAALADSFSICTSFTMTGKKVTLTALYKPASVWSPVIDTINGSTVYYYFPPGKIKGLITFYHGSGGSANNWFTDEFEVPFLQYAVEEGYAVFATESKNRVAKQWDLSGPNSVDILNMSVMFSTLRSRGLTKKGTKIFGVGMSDGSNFCSLISDIDSFSASALYCAAGQAKNIQKTTAPTEWCISNDDTTLSANMMTQAQNNYQTLSNRGIDAQFLIHYANPVFPTIFAQQQSFDSLDSWNVYNGLKSGGMLNDSDFIVVDPLKVKPWERYVPAAYSSKDNFIQGELVAAAAEHRFHNYFEYETLQFFDNHTPIKKTTVLQQPTATSSSAFKISVYPNPADNYFNFQSTSIVNSITVLNAIGKIVKQIAPESMTGEFSCSDLSGGIYFMTLKDENGNVASQKILIHH
jgi:hypothetical protein